jgi:hypothetical protein
MIPSLLQIPSAVSDSKLHSVLPNNGKGDFTFDRSTGATRINRDGLIEEVGYFSSELVQNGDFSELGSELVTNGDFATNSDWTLATGWTINNSKLVGNSIFGNAVQDINFTNGKTYKVTFTISDYVKGKVRFQFTGGSTVNGTARDANGVYTQYIVATANHTDFKLRGVSDSGGFTGKIDNVSVKQVDPNDRWTVTANVGWNITDKANYEDSITNSVYQSGLTLTSGKKYKLTFTISDASGTALMWIGNYAGAVNYEGGSYRSFTNGNHTIVFNMPSDQTTLAFFGNTGGSSFSLDNISLVEVQGDRPRLSYDITNGVVEDKPHLLLEPSRTNLVTHSNDTSTYSHYDYGGGLIVDSYGYLSPDGTQNASRLVYTNSSTGSGGALLTQNITLNATGTYTISLYAKSISGTKRIRISPKNTGSQGTAGFIINMTSEWQRFTHTFTNDGGTSRGFQFRITETEDSGDRTFDVWGMTIEEGSFATSVIPTAGTTITRAAETCNNSKPSVNSTEGVLYCEIAALTDLGSYRLISLSDGTLNQRISILYDITDNKIYGQCVNSTTQAFIPFVPTSISNMNKIAFKYKANDFALWVNGVEVGVDTSGVIPTGLDKLSFDRGDGVDDWYGKVKGLAVYNEALSESQLMQLTGVTASSIYNNFVTRTASFTVEALNEVKKVIDNL